MTARDDVIGQLVALENPRNAAGMARYGIRPRRALGITVATLRGIAKTIGRDHALAAGLWSSGIHEARILASLIDDPQLVTPQQMEAWAGEFDSWDLVDQCCTNLFRKAPGWQDVALAWSARDEEYVKRAAFVLMAQAAVHDKRAPEAFFLAYMPLLESGAADPRNYVKKAVSWALRQIGKRNAALSEAVCAASERLLVNGNRHAAWVGRDVLRELGSEAVRARLKYVKVWTPRGNEKWRSHPATQKN